MGFLSGAFFRIGANWSVETALYTTAPLMQSVSCSSASCLDTCACARCPPSLLCFRHGIPGRVGPVKRHLAYILPRKCGRLTLLLVGGCRRMRHDRQEIYRCKLYAGAAHHNTGGSRLQPHQIDWHPPVLLQLEVRHHCPNGMTLSHSSGIGHIQRLPHTPLAFTTDCDTYSLAQCGCRRTAIPLLDECWAQCWSVHAAAGILVA